MEGLEFEPFNHNYRGRLLFRTVQGIPHPDDRGVETACKKATEKGAPVVVSVKGGLGLRRYSERMQQYYDRGDFKTDEAREGQQVRGVPQNIPAQAGARQPGKGLYNITQSWELPNFAEVDLSSFKATTIDINGSELSVKKYLSVPFHLLARFPAIGTSPALHGTIKDETRLYLAHYQLIRLLKAASWKEPFDNRKFATLIYSQWNYSKWDEKQLRQFIDFVINAGAPVTLLLDLCRPIGYALYGSYNRTVIDWITCWIAAAMARGRYDLAKALAIRLDLYGVAVRLSERNEARLDFHFGNYEAAYAFVRQAVKNDTKMHLNMREHNKTRPLTEHRCAFGYRGCVVTGSVEFLNRHNLICVQRDADAVLDKCADCGLILQPNVAEDDLVKLRHRAKCERRLVVWTDDVSNLDLFEKPLFPPSGPFGGLFLVPADSNDRVACQVFDERRERNRGLIFKLDQVKRYWNNVLSRGAPRWYFLVLAAYQKTVCFC